MVANKAMPGTPPVVKGLANKGQGGDNMIAHLTGGEAIIPREILLANPELAQILHNAFTKVGADPMKFIAGSPQQSINPKTGMPEFSFWTSIRNIGEEALGTIAGTAIGGPAGGAIGAGLVSAAQGNSLTQDAIAGVGGYLGGGSLLNGADAVGNSALDAVGDTADATLGAGQTIGSELAGLGSSISSGANSLTGGLIGTAAPAAAYGAPAVDDALNGFGATVGASSGLPSTAGDFLNGASLNTAGTIASAPATGLGTVAAQGATAGTSLMSTLGAAPSWLSPVATLGGAALNYEGQQNANNILQKAQAQQQANVAPYIQNGNTAQTQEANLVESPAAQLAYIQNNPLYNSLATQATNTLLANQAAQGKVGSGGTAAALQDQLLQLGTGLVNNQVANLGGIANTGASAAVGQGPTAANLATGTATTAANSGGALANGLTGAANTYQGATYQQQLQAILAQQRLQAPNVATYQPTA